MTSVAVTAMAPPSTTWAMRALVVGVEQQAQRGRAADVEHVQAPAAGGVRRAVGGDRADDQAAAALEERPRLLVEHLSSPDRLLSGFLAFAYEPFRSGDRPAPSRSSSIPTKEPS